MESLSQEKFPPSLNGNDVASSVDAAISSKLATSHQEIAMLGESVSKIRPISAATVKVYARHRLGCSKRDDPQCRTCGCPKWIYENYEGKDRRFSARTRSWSRAEALRQEIEDLHDPVRLELKKLKERQEAKRILLHDAADSYLADICARHLSRSTESKARLTVAKRLLPWCDRNHLCHLDELTVPQLTKWRSTWKLSPLSSQIEQERTVAFLWFCVRQGWLEGNPAKLLSRIKVKRTPTDYYPRDEFEQIVKATYRFPRQRTSKFADKLVFPLVLRTMVLLMRWSGLRIGDAVNLERSRLLGDKILLYQGKTGEPVFVPLPHEVAESLRNLPSLEATLNTRFFFKCTFWSNAQAMDLWRRAFRKLFRIANIRLADGTPKRCHSHMLRDTFAVENLLAGVPLDQVSILLGHSSIKTTERHYSPWVRARQQQLEKSVEKAHAMQGITKSAAVVPSGDKANKPANRTLKRTSSPTTSMRRPKPKPSPSRSTGVDPKRSAAAKRAWITIRAKHKAVAIGRLKPRAA